MVEAFFNCSKVERYVRRGGQGRGGREEESGRETVTNEEKRGKKIYLH
jgi:hypothetical protein